jgi:hypothetical protein
MPLQIRRGTDAERQSMTVPLAPGEMLYTTDTQKIYVGNGTTLGGILTSGFNDDDAKDAAAEMILDGSHSGIAFSYDIENKSLSATAEFNDDSAKDAAADIFTSGSHNGINFVYNDVSKSIVATIDLSIGVTDGSDYKINIVGDDSTLIVNSSTRQVTAAGGLFGPLITNSIDSGDSGSINVAPVTFFSSNAIVEGELFVQDKLSIISSDPGITATIFETVGDHNGSINVSFAKARGTFATSTEVINGDQLGNIIMQGFAGGDFQTGSSIKTQVDGTVSGTILPSKMLFATTNAEGELDTRVVINPSGRLTTFNGIEMAVNDSTELGESNFRGLRSRGTIDDPTQVVNGDIIFSLVGSGYDSVEYSNSAGIAFQVDGAVSTGVVPAKILFTTVDNAGNLTSRVVINASGRLSLFNGGELFVNDNTVTGNTNLRGLRSRGTSSVPLAVVTGDNLLNIVSAGHDGTSYNSAASISFQVDSTVSTGTVPGRLVFSTADSLGSLTTRMTIDSNGRVVSLGGITIPNNAVNTDMIIMSNYHSTGNDANNLAFRRGRGTFSAPSVIQPNDRIYDINWGGFDGTIHTTACAINGLVGPGDVSSGVVPGQLDFIAANNSGVLATRVSFDAFKATFNVAPRVPNYAGDTEANTAVGTPEAGMMYFDTLTNKGKMYDGTAWRELF